MEGSTLCLNLIVKNKALVITEILKNWVANLTFDYWVISDTGSTDNTKQLIIDFFNDQKIKGELFDDKWKNYSYNRTKCIGHAFNKTDRVLVLRTQDVIGPSFRFPDTITNPSYYLKVENDTFSYPRCLFLDNRLKWKFVGEIKQWGDAPRTESIYALTYTPKEEECNA